MDSQQILESSNEKKEKLNTSNISATTTLSKKRQNVNFSRSSKRRKIDNNENQDSVFIASLHFGGIQSSNNSLFTSSSSSSSQNVFESTNNKNQTLSIHPPLIKETNVTPFISNSTPTPSSACTTSSTTFIPLNTDSSEIEPDAENEKEIKKREIELMTMQMRNLINIQKKRELEEESTKMKMVYEQIEQIWKTKKNCNWKKQTSHVCNGQKIKCNHVYQTINNIESNSSPLFSCHQCKENSKRICSIENFPFEIYILNNDKKSLHVCAPPYTCSGPSPSSKISNDKFAPRLEETTPSGSSSITPTYPTLQQIFDRLNREKEEEEYRLHLHLWKKVDWVYFCTQTGEMHICTIETCNAKQVLGTNRAYICSITLNINDSKNVLTLDAAPGTSKSFYSKKGSDEGYSFTNNDNNDMDMGENDSDNEETQRVNNNIIDSSKELDMIRNKTEGNLNQHKNGLLPTSQPFSSLYPDENSAYIKFSKKQPPLETLLKKGKTDTFIENADENGLIKEFVEISEWREEMTEDEEQQDEDENPFEKRHKEETQENFEKQKEYEKKRRSFLSKKSIEKRKQQSKLSINEVLRMITNPDFVTSYMKQQSKHSKDGGKRLAGSSSKSVYSGLIASHTIDSKQSALIAAMTHIAVVFSVQRFEGLKNYETNQMIQLLGELNKICSRAHSEQRMPTTNELILNVETFMKTRYIPPDMTEFKNTPSLREHLILLYAKKCVIFWYILMSRTNFKKMTSVSFRDFVEGALAIFAEGIYLTKGEFLFDFTLIKKDHMLNLLLIDAKPILRQQQKLTNGYSALENKKTNHITKLKTVIKTAIFNRLKCIDEPTDINESSDLEVVEEEETEEEKEKKLEKVKEREQQQQQQQTKLAPIHPESLCVEIEDYEKIQNVFFMQNAVSSNSKKHNDSNSSSNSKQKNQKKKQPPQNKNKVK